MPSNDLTLDEFETIVGEALESLPKRFADLVDDVVVIVEDEPSADDRAKMAGDRELLGVYRGVSLLNRSNGTRLGPDEIVLFCGPINRVTRTREEAVEQVRETVIHEFGHYFGLSDEEMPR